MTGPLADETGMIAGTVADVAAPAEWARYAALQVLDALLFADGREAQIIACASAIEAANKAATERERERCAIVAEGRRYWPSILSHYDVARAIAAAIRKGGDSD